jgi:hypothetical protein
MNVKWLEHTDSNQLFMNQSMLNKLDLKEQQQMTVTYGSLARKKELMIDNEIPDNMIGLSVYFTKEVLFPTDVIYEVILKDDDIKIGPLIGMLLAKDQKKLTNKKLNLFKERIRTDELIKGVIFVVCHDWIDETNYLMKGYYYTKHGKWKEGIFPFPTVLYNRTYIKKRKLKKLTNKVNMYVFNNCLMTKKKLWKLLCKDPLVNHHLPFTQTLKDVDSFIVMIDHFNTVYLKPSNLSRGRGIVQAKKTKLGYQIKDSHNREQTLFTKHEIEQFISSLPKKHHYLIQQGVPFMYGKSLVDFRVYMQKDETRRWNSSGIYGRVSKPEQIITNLKHSQEIIQVEQALKKYFHLDQDQRIKTQQEMIRVCKNICTALEGKGEMLGDVAVDVVVDEQKKVWVLEVQVNYAADERLYHLPAVISKKVWQTPILYAKALTGFNKGEYQ